MTKFSDVFVNDVAHALKRTLRRPGFTLISSLTLGLALGASVVAFAILYGYLFRPLPYTGSGQLLVPRIRLVKGGLVGPQVSVRFYHTLRQLPEFHSAALYSTDAATTAVNGEHEFEIFTHVTPSTFPLLGVEPLLGTTLSPASGNPGGPHEVVLSYAYWQKAFDGKADVLGKTLVVSGTAFQIVGVMPKRLVFPIRGTAFWTPFVITPAMAKDSNINYDMLIRTPPGWTLQRVNAMLGSIRDREMRSMSPAEQAHVRAQGFEIDAVPYRQVLLANLGGALPFWGLWAATLLLLFMTVLNSMNLALARQRQRLGEMQLRQILGAGRTAIMRMTLFEYVPILVLTGVIAAALASYCISLLHSYELPSPYMPFEISFGSVTIAYLIVIAVVAVSSIAGSAIATILLSRKSIGAVQELGQHGTVSRAFRQTQRVFAAVQICLTLILVITSALLSQSLIGLFGRPLNFDKNQVTVATVLLPRNTNAHDFWRQAHSVFSNLPGTRAAAISNMVPFGDQNDNGMFNASNKPTPRVHAFLASVGPGFSRALGIQFIAGRPFEPSDEQGHPNSVIVSAALAQHLFGKTDVVGETLNGGLHIIGVVPSVTWQFNPADNQHGYAVYTPTWYGHIVQILIKSDAGPAVLWPTIRRAVATTEPDAAIWRLRSLPRIMQQASLNRSALTWMVVTFGALAFLIAVFGVYAIVAYSTRLRLFEFAIRQVLGASRGAILALTLKEITVLLLAGGAIGIAIAYVIAQGLHSLLYSVGTLDPVAYIGSLVLIAIAVLVAAALPVWRATRRNPAEIMRE